MLHQQGVSADQVRRRGLVGALVCERPERFEKIQYQTNYKILEFRISNTPRGLVGALGLWRARLGRLTDSLRAQ